VTTELYPKEARNRVRRHPERGRYDAASIYPIVDEALICHVGFVDGGQPYVIPTLHAREGDTILLHGARASRLLQHLEAGGEVCITVTLLDGIVLARSVFSHSINYRSAVIFGRGQPITDLDERMRALELFTERLIPGRWADARPPTPAEMQQTGVVAVPIESASAKIRTGPPKDGAEDLALPVWAGVLPLHLATGAPLPDAALPPDTPLPDYISGYRRTGD
jgi:nitroimidazol reductase NimA-like FMN-containing flavoprotein (pyridoxamine 5'-phosphate oxidase superfamily)